MLFPECYNIYHTHRKNNFSLCCPEMAPGMRLSSPGTSVPLHSRFTPEIKTLNSSSNCRQSRWGGEKLCQKFRRKRRSLKKTTPSAANSFVFSRYQVLPLTFGETLRLHYDVAVKECKAPSSVVIFHVTREVISQHQTLRWLLLVCPQLFFSFHLREWGV